MSVVYETPFSQIEDRLLEELRQQLGDEKSCFNLYTFKKGDTLSKEEILYDLRTLYVSIRVEGTKYEKHCHMGYYDGDIMSDGSIQFAVDYAKFIDIVIKHYNINVVKQCSADECHGLICEEFLMGHFRDAKTINLVSMVQCARDAKDFKRKVLKVMKGNIGHWKKDSNSGGTGLSLDGFYSFYTGSLFVNDFEIVVHLCDSVCIYQGIKKSSVQFDKSNYWEKLYKYLLKKSGATLF